MRPYYQDQFVALYLGNCQEVLSLLPKADLLLTDPPYRQSKSGGGLIGKRKTYQTIQELSDFDPSWLCQQLASVSKAAHGYIFCSKSLVPVYCDFIDGRGWGWDILVYAKANPLPAKNNKYLTDAEFIIFYREPSKCYFNNDLPYENYFKVKWTTCQPAQFEHPTEKDVSIIASLIQVSTRPNEIVLDLYSGSGTTLYTAKELGRQAVGVEIEERYCEVAARRCETTQPALFVTSPPRERPEQSAVFTEASA